MTAEDRQALKRRIDEAVRAGLPKGPPIRAGSVLRHGTESGYKHGPCRCRPCVDAAKDARRQRHLRNPDKLRRHWRENKRAQRARLAQAAKGTGS